MNGSFAFQTRWAGSSGKALADGLLGAFYTYNEAANTRDGFFPYSQIEWYVSDNWKVTHRLTLDFGIRFNYMQPQYVSLQSAAMSFLRLAAAIAMGTFLEAGKGVVVLHPVIADYNSWPWWWQEVVGGRYLPNAHGDVPASKFKEDVDVVVQPTSERSPITSAIGPMHVKDEVIKATGSVPKKLPVNPASPR